MLYPITLLFNFILLVLLHHFPSNYFRYPPLLCVQRRRMSVLGIQRK
jgi:hypothetical protein